MIALTTPSLDLSGALISPNGRAIAQTINRRANRVAVLDLTIGAVAVDAGYSGSDLELSVRVPDPDGSEHLALTRLIALYPTMILSCSRGCYLVMLSGLGYSNGAATCRASVLEVLS